jgi:hypothetical protein
VYNEDIRQTDKILLNEVTLALLEVADPSFKDKYAQQVRSLAVLLSIFNQKNWLLPLVKQEISKSKMNLNYLILRDRKYYANQKVFLSVRKDYFYRERFLRKSKIPPKRYIGVGYKDKGARKDVAYDGSPSWQEVASSIIYTTSGENNIRKVLSWNHTSIYDESKSWIRLIHSKLLSSFS